MAFTIDVQHPILPDVFHRATNDVHDPVGGIKPPPRAKESMLSSMDDAGIDVATSIPATSMYDSMDSLVHGGGLMPPTGSCTSLVARWKTSGRMDGGCRW